MSTETIHFLTSDDIRLEGRLLTPDDPRGAAIVCHPHPQMQGSMSSSLVPRIQRALGAAGWAALRFNFRGVGRSEGSYGAGIAEIEDARAALGRAGEAAPRMPKAVAGWSFGSMVGFHTALATPGVESVVIIAPPISIKPHMDLPTKPDAQIVQAWRGRTLAIVGTEDGFCTPGGLKRWADDIPGAEVRVIDGADHFFSNTRDELAETVATFIAGA